MAGLRKAHTALLVSTALLLAACQQAQKAGDDTTVAAAATSVTLVDRDVEAPEVFQVTDEALWDGRPSLGGVWVASPDAIDPERVILRNPANGKFVIGALFKREAFNPGPPLQISSDAAEALGMLAGQPARISVTALRREEAPAEADASKPLLDANEGISATTLGETAEAAIARAEVKPLPRPARAAAAAPEDASATPPAEETAAAAPAPKAPVITSTPDQPATPAAATGATVSLQIGIFSVEENASRAKEKLDKAGIPAKVRKETTQGKTWWSVSATGPGPRDALLAKVKGLGFTDAYIVR